ncbi:MAG: ATP-dependent endonuclease [Acidobacteriota bacterium]
MQIQSFRSIRSVEIEPLADFTSFAGLNNSGKSNVLRALNAFFNNETDPNEPVNVDADYYRPDLRKKKRKCIRVSVTFELPDNFRFRRGLEGVKDLLGDGPFTIAKEWSRDNPLPSVDLNDNQLGLDDRQKVVQFLQLIKYRYIPNRVLPTELIRSEHQSLRNVLVRRLAKAAKGDLKAFENICETSARMIESLAKRFQEACPEQRSVSLATPTSWNDLAFAFGYRLTRDGVEIKDVEQGSGIQSLLMLETLYLIDRDYFQQFGWRQAAIWGLEEPESSMHSSLEARVAAYLADITANPRNRLQLLCTTHSDLVVQYAGCTVVVEQRNGESKCDPVQDDPREALSRLSGAGVARWVHPILLWPLDPIILVEGRFDREFLEESFRYFKPNRPVHVVDLPALDPNAGGGGVERMRQYIKDSASAIRSRRPEAPIIVLLDWDAKAKQGKFKTLVTGTPPYKVLAWPKDSANPKAGKSFKGLERFHCDRVLELAIDREAPIGKKTRGAQAGHYLVEVADYDKVKEVLASIVREGLQESDFLHAKEFIQEILREAGAK